MHRANGLPVAGDEISRLPTRNLNLTLHHFCAHSLRHSSPLNLRVHYIDTPPYTSLLPVVLIYTRGSTRIRRRSVAGSGLEVKVFQVLAVFIRTDELKSTFATRLGSDTALR